MKRKSIPQSIPHPDIPLHFGANRAFKLLVTRQALAMELAMSLPLDTETINPLLWKIAETAAVKAETAVCAAADAHMAYAVAFYAKEFLKPAKTLRTKAKKRRHGR